MEGCPDCDREMRPENPYPLCYLCAFRECEVCGEYGDDLEIETHHASYVFDVAVNVCQECHYRIHNNPGFRDDLLPYITRSAAREKGLLREP